jgi:hypothetical protein
VVSSDGGWPSTELKSAWDLGGRIPGPICVTLGPNPRPALGDQPAGEGRKPAFAPWESRMRSVCGVVYAPTVLEPIQRRCLPSGTAPPGLGPAVKALPMRSVCAVAYTPPDLESTQPRCLCSGTGAAFLRAGSIQSGPSSGKV